MGNSPLDHLIFSAREFFDDVAVPACDASLKDPGNRSKALAGAVLLFHVLDWAIQERVITEADFLATCPYGWTLKEIALGAKHRDVSNPSVVRTMSMTKLTARGYSQGDYGQGPIGPALQTTARRLPGDEREWTYIGEIFAEVDAWWRQRLP
ncbi:MAG: hypothetical protein WAL33_16680 [Caulobacter sp.]